MRCKWCKKKTNSYSNFAFGICEPCRLEARQEIKPCYILDPLPSDIDCIDHLGSPTHKRKQKGV